MTTCSKRVKKIYPINFYQTEVTLFDKLDFFGIEYANEQTPFKNIAKFDFESICVQQGSLKVTNYTKWIGKHIANSVSISSYLVTERIFLCNSDPHRLVTSFIGAPEILALQSKALRKNLFFDIKTTIKN